MDQPENCTESASTDESAAGDLFQDGVRVRWPRISRKEKRVRELVVVVDATEEKKPRRQPIGGSPIHNLEDL